MPATIGHRARFTLLVGVVSLLAAFSPAPVARALPNGKLVAADPRPGATFGSAVAISGSLVVVGAKSDNDPTDPGAVYVFIRDGDQWRQQKLTSPDPTGHDQFGQAVVTDGSVIAVGAPFHDPSGFGTGRGAVYLYPVTNGAIGAPTKLTSRQTGSGTAFGYALALSNDLLIVGEPDRSTIADTNDGLATVFVRRGTVWSQATELRERAGSFGASVATDGRRIVVGAPDAASDSGVSGAAYVIDSTVGSASTKLNPFNNTGIVASFGRSVAVRDETIAVGAAESVTGGTQPGSVHLFKLRGNTWEQANRLTNPDTSDGTSAFGWSLAISGEAMVVGDPNRYEGGVPNGAAYLYRFDGNSWSYQQAVSVPAESGDSGQFLGQAVAVGHDSLANRFTVLAGAPFADHSGVQDAGATHIIEVQPPLKTNVAVGLTVEKVVGGEGIEGPTQGEPDFYAKLGLNGAAPVQTDTIEGKNEILPRWMLTSLVDAAASRSVAVTVDLWDEDDFLGGDDDHIDITATPDRTLRFALDLTTCSVSGDIAGLCSTRLYSSGTSDQAAQIWIQAFAKLPTVQFDGVLRGSDGEPIIGRGISLHDDLSGALIAQSVTSSSGLFNFNTTTPPGVVLRVEIDDCATCALVTPQIFGSGVRPVVAADRAVRLPACAADETCRYANVSLQFASFTAANWPAIRQVDPYGMTPNQIRPITVQGQFFQSGATANLDGVPLANVNIAADGRSLTADLPSGLGFGRYDLTITNPGGSSVTLADAITIFTHDNGLRPNPDGYNFQNPAGGNYLSVAGVLNIFGPIACGSFVGGTCSSLTAKYELWRKDANEVMKGGHCYGMSMTALRFLRGNSDFPANYESVATTYALSQTIIMPHVAEHFARQLTSVVRAERWRRQQFTPTEVLDQVRKSLDPSNTNPMSLDVFDYTGTSGHTVTPYAIEERGNGVFRIRVYDNNHPDARDMYVEIDTFTNSWRYDDLGKTYGGSAATHTIDVIPLSVHNSPLGPLPLSQQSYTTGAVTPAEGSFVEVWSMGKGDVLISDPSGRSIGRRGGQLVDDVPGATRVLTTGGLGPSTPIYTLPATSTHTITFDSQAFTATTSMALTQYSDNGALGISDVSIAPGEQDQVSIDASSTEVSFHAAAPRTPTITIAQDGTNVSYSLTLVDVDIDAGRTAMARVDRKGGALVFSNKEADGGSYTLAMSRIAQGSVTRFTSTPITIAAGATHTFDYGNWAGNDLTLKIDANSDGSIDQTITLVNQTPPTLTLHTIYLPLTRK